VGVQAKGVNHNLSEHQDVHVDADEPPSINSITSVDSEIFQDHQPHFENSSEEESDEHQSQLEHGSEEESENHFLSKREGKKQTQAYSTLFRMPEDFPSQQNRTKEFLNGHTFTFQNSVNGIEYYRCDFSVSQKCPGRVILQRNGELKHGLKAHTCHKNFGRPEAAKFVHNAKEQAKHSGQSTKRILSGAGQLSQEVFPNVPPEHNLKRTCQRSRASTKYPIPNPTDSKFEIPEKFKKTTTNPPTKFLYIDTGKDDPSRILGFTTLKFMTVLFKSQTIYSDGTFSVVPLKSGVYQLYTLHGEVSALNNETKTLPLVFCLLPNKSEDTYTRMLAEIVRVGSELGLTPKASEFMIDFEYAMINAIRTVMTVADIILCYFHFNQSIWRKIGASHLVVEYEESEEVRRGSPEKNQHHQSSCIHP